MLKLEDWGVCDDVLRRGDIGFIEADLQGRSVTPDLAALLTLAAANQAVLEQAVCRRSSRKLLCSAGLDARFKRLWNSYPSYCEAGFRDGSSDGLQVEMSRA